MTAVLVTRGDVDLTEIKATLPYDKIIVWDNSKVEVDRGVYGRYEALKYVDTPVVYFQDDDVIFREHDKLLEAYEPGKLVGNMNEEWVRDCKYSDLVMVGLGALVDRDLPAKMFKRYLDAYTPDEHFIQECDFIFGVLAPHKRVDLPFEMQACASDYNRLWKQDWQFDAKWAAIHRARALRTVTLAMLVKNEVDNAWNAIESARGLYDHVTVIDTGSTDGTVEMLEEKLAGIPHTIESRPFVNFGHNRDELIELAAPHADYILMMDADETLERDPDFRWPELSKDIYYLNYTGEVSYAHPRLFRSCLPWRFNGIVHAYLGTEWVEHYQHLKTPLVRHHGLERHDQGRLVEDVQLLAKMIVEDPKDAHSFFMLAKALEGLGQVGPAEEVFRQRVSMGGWDEEVFYSRYRLGCLTATYSSFLEGALELLRAWDGRQHRAEPLRALAAACKDIADRLPYPEGEILFVHRSDYCDRENQQLSEGG